MTLKKIFAICLAITVLGACSNRQVYQGLQSSFKSRCKPELNQHARAECLEGFDRDYHHYKLERYDLLKGLARHGSLK